MDQRITLHINVKKLMHKHSKFDEEASCITGFFYCLLFPYLGVLYQPESIFCNAESG